MMKAASVLPSPLRAQVSTTILEQKWAAAEAELKQIFPKVPDELWVELKGLTVYGERHRVLEASDPHVHAYLLAQLFGLVVMDTINRHVGLIPVHARLGCVGDSCGVTITVSGLEFVDRDAVEQDFLDHLASELNKFRAVALLN